MTKSGEFRVTEDGRIYRSGRKKYPNGDAYSVRHVSDRIQRQQQSWYCKAVVHTRYITLHLAAAAAAAANIITVIMRTLMFKGCHLCGV